MRKAVTMVCILLLAGLALAQRPPGWDGQVSPEDEILYGRPAQEALCTNPAGTAPMPPGEGNQGWVAGKVPDGVNRLSRRLQPRIAAWTPACMGSGCR